MSRQRKTGVLAAAILAALAVLAAACGSANPPAEGGSAASEQPAGELATATSAGREAGPTVSDSDIVVPLFAPYDREGLALVFGLLAEDFQSLGELSKASPAIVVGEVVETEYAPYQNIPFTIVTLRVEQGIRGDFSEGEQLTIVETGGGFAGRSKDKPGETGRPVEGAFEGVPVMKTGERWLLFLRGYDPGPVATGAYSVKGAFQGKFRLSDDDRIMFTADPERFDEQLFTVQRLAAGRTLAAVLADIEGGP